MAWVELTKNHIKSRLSQYEIEAIEETGGGDSDRLAGIITQVTSLVRSKVASCHRNTLGDSGLIPEETIHAASSIAKYNLSTTVASSMTEADEKSRVLEYRDAMNFLEKIANCEVNITTDDGSVERGSEGTYGGADLMNF